MKLHFHLIFSVAIAAALGMGGEPASAAPCCGSGLPTPSLITGDEKAILGATLNYSEIYADAYPSGLWRRRDYLDASETIKVEGAHIIADRWQLGASVPVVRRKRVATSSSGLGDIAASIGFEYLPDWEYNPWRPKGIAYLQLTLPSSDSTEESDTRTQLAGSGRGFWSIGFGTLLTKGVNSFDFFSSFEVHRSIQRTYVSGQSRRTLVPGYGGNLGIGAGYSLGAFRAGTSITWTYEDNIEVLSSISSKGTPQRFATLVASLGYQISEDWSALLSYSDQTRFGSPLNTGLGKSVALGLQKHWFR